jgi:hypothetical protein
MSRSNCTREHCKKLWRQGATAHLGHGLFLGAYAKGTWCIQGAIAHLENIWSVAEAEGANAHLEKKCHK